VKFGLAAATEPPVAAAGLWGQPISQPRIAVTPDAEMTEKRYPMV
jgi:hypothetical protein